MKAFKRGLCGSLATLGVLALTGGAAAQAPRQDDTTTPTPRQDDTTTTQQGDTTTTQQDDTTTSGTSPDGVPAPPVDHRNNNDHTPPAGDAAHDPRADAANLPDPASPPPTDTTTWSETDTPEVTAPRGSFMSDIGFALAAGAGVDGFTDATARGATNDGGGWDVRAIIGTRLRVAGEIAYIGSAQRIDALGVDENALLVGNGVQADVRINVLRGRTLQPYVFGGAAWRRYGVTNTDTNTSDISDSDDVLEFPVGAGVGFRFSGMMIDARGEYRAATDNDLMPSANAGGGAAELNRYGVKLNVGYEF
ncbi:MAG: outer membrane beta-barrel protein [Deltaproteobacteria bacterium]|nr:outer membrane beta-barrel protein [Deltaproteobacteria bacterium]MDQ3297128.1 porin family protein [Myxococcota bacterium]